MKKRILVVIGVVVLVLVILPIVVPWFSPGSGINCVEEDINITTGQGRRVRRLWFAVVSCEQFDTPLSVALGGQTYGSTDGEPWRRVNTSSPGLGHSPHYRYHGALHQAKEFEVAVQLTNLSPQRQREVAQAILTSWQRTGGYFQADKILSEMLEEEGDKTQPLNDAPGETPENRSGGTP